MGTSQSLLKEVNFSASLGKYKFSLNMWDDQDFELHQTASSVLQRDLSLNRSLIIC